MRDLTRQWYRRWTRLLRLVTGRHKERGSLMLVGKSKRRRRTLATVEHGRRLMIAGTGAVVMRRLGMIHYCRIIRTDGILRDGRCDGITRTVHKARVAWRSWGCRHH